MAWIREEFHNRLEVSGFSAECSAALLCFAGIHERYQTFFSLIGAGVDVPLLWGLSAARVRSAFFYEQKGGKDNAGFAKNEPQS